MRAYNQITHRGKTFLLLFSTFYISTDGHINLKKCSLCLFGFLLISLFGKAIAWTKKKQISFIIIPCRNINSVKWNNTGTMQGKNKKEVLGTQIGKVLNWPLDKYKLRGCYPLIQKAPTIMCFYTQVVDLVSFRTNKRKHYLGALYFCFC